MPEEFDDETPSHDESQVVDKMLDELGVDPELKEELIESGRLKSDVVRVESARDVRRNMEIEKSYETLKESMNLLEHNLMMIDEAIDRVERDVVPIVLTFLVNLKGSLVSLKETIIGRSRRKAKTNLQLTFIENDVAPIVEEEFGIVEGTLTSGMSEPLLEKVKDIVEGLKSVLQNSLQELSTLKSSVGDYTQRTLTELEFLQTELIKKPQETIPKETMDHLETLERRVEELQRDLNIALEKLANREEQIRALQDQLAVEKARVEALESRISTMKAAPAADTAQIAELRQQLKAAEAAKELLEEKLSAAKNETEEAVRVGSELRAEIAQRDLKIEDLTVKIHQLNAELERNKERLTEIDELRAKLRSYESGDIVRETARLKSELERVSASHERTARDYEAIKQELATAKRTIDTFTKLMNTAEKTKAFLTVADVGEMTIRELARFIGVSPAVVTKWAESYEELGIAKIVDDKVVVIGPENNTSGSTE